MSARFLQRIWRRLQAENIPRLLALFGVAIVATALSVYWVERRSNEGFKTLGDGFWWSIVTLTSTGYGDRYPTTGTGRFLASLAMVLGLGITAIVTARIAAVMVEKKIKEGRGLTDADRLSGHVVILGYKPDLALFIQEVLEITPELSTNRLVLVNLATELQMDELRRRFEGVVYIRGDMIDPLALQRANIQRATKAIILADASGDRSDQEVDARTVMTNMTVKSLAPQCYTCAEVFDKKYLEHLQLARCDEVVLSREYARSLLVNATVASGITFVVHNLLDLADLKGLFTEAIPEEYLGKTFGDYASHLKSHGQMLIGLLENTGQSIEIKREALREAQKTAHVGTLVDNLRKVKSMEPNKSVLAPPDGHVIPHHALAIVIGRPDLGEQTQKART